MFEVLVCLFHVLLGQHDTGLPLSKYCVVVLIVIHIVIDPIPNHNVMYEVLVCLFHVLLGQHDTGLPLWKYCVHVVIIHYIA